MITTAGVGGRDAATLQNGTFSLSLLGASNPKPRPWNYLYLRPADRSSGATDTIAQWCDNLPLKLWPLQTVS